ncbi:MAG: signal peptide peptidase SppA [bacterium]
MSKRKGTPGASLLRGIARGPMASRIIGKVRITGPVLPMSSGYPPLRGTVPDRIIQKIKWAKGRGLRALIVEINSPGGAVVASKEIGDAIKAAGLITVAWIRDVGASGAYWIASACNRIVADPCSTVGSIGVFSPHLEISELMKKYGIKYEGFKSGNFKDMGVPFRKSNEKEKKLITEHLRKLHDIFIKEIAENRGLEMKVVKKISQGQVYLGEEAKRIGLVDKLGGREEVVRQCEIAGNFRSLMVVDIEDFREEFFSILRSFFSDAPLSAIRQEFARGMTDFFSSQGRYFL